MGAASVYFKGRWKSQTFTSNGTFTVPSKVTTVFVEMVGGGGGGGTGANGTHAAVGGEGAKPVQTFVSVTPGGSVPVTIGVGGAGGNPSGAAGTDSSFGSLVAQGANGGGEISGVFGSFTTLLTGGLGRSGYRGAGGTSPGSSDQRGFGGDGSYGNGGTGRDRFGVSPAGNGSYGAGGGGDASNNDSPGNGGNGICIVYWKED